MSDNIVSFFCFFDIGPCNHFRPCSLSVSCEESDSCNYSMVCFYNHLFRGKQKGFQITCIGFLWIIFFPNSFYLMTDIIHLGKGIRTAPVWFDAISLLSYGICGLLFGIVSLKMMEEKACELFGRKRSAVVRVVFIYVSCFGIFLGRFLRWNTWDLLMNFFNLASDVAGLFFCLPKFLFVCKFTFVAGTFLNLLYIVLVHFNVKNLEEKRQA